MATLIGRRTFITALSAAAAWPSTAGARQSGVPVVGYLYTGSRAVNVGLPGFVEGLRESGMVEGRNVAVEYLFGDAQPDRLPTLAADLVRRNVAVIFAGSNAAALAAKAATRTIPIVFWVGADPVKLGLVASLAHPGGNVTGLAGLTLEVVAKRLQLLHDMVPQAIIVGALENPTNPDVESDTREVQEAARKLGLQLHIVTAGNEREIDAGFETLAQRKAGALIVAGDPFFAQHRERVVALAARHGMPTIYAGGNFPQVGGLVSYVSDLADQYRQAAGYVGRILKGEKAADLPVTQSSKIKFVLNLKTAKALRLTIQPGLLAIVDEVIE